MKSSWLFVLGVALNQRSPCRRKSYNFPTSSVALIHFGICINKSGLFTLLEISVCGGRIAFKGFKFVLSSNKKTKLPGKKGDLAD